MVELNFVSSSFFFQDPLYCEGFNEDNFTVRILKRNSVDFSIVIGIIRGGLTSNTSQSVCSSFKWEIILPCEEV